ncbi:hypothetical protein AVO44_05545 [Ruegeria profundi]|uniref:Transposase IS4-like domain-containing protein n=1 Tax=Ruegeria profundi TaxID=1685378 RepID=A0A0X3U0I7_9RHOB|nr:hypothetical protein AVO44_05545 [Ruegeria profundi]
MIPKIAKVIADGAYNTHKCHNVITARDAAAIIPPRKNAKLWKPTTAGAIARNEAVRAAKYQVLIAVLNWYTNPGIPVAETVG